MCGIAGHLAPELGDGEGVHRMLDALAHRGPDGEGTWRDGPCVLGHRRLAIIDLSEAGRQPMSNEDGDVAISVVGEIYNHAELRRDLEAKGHRFRSRTDIEVIAHLWEERGVEVPALLRGMFALAIWDRRARTLFLARDRYGEKALYWTFGARGLVFASELPAIRAFAATQEIDLDALDAYLALQYIPAPATIFAGIHKLMPGHAILVAPGVHPEPVPYATIDFTPRYAGIDATEAAGEVRRIVEDAVRVRLMSDVPLGAFLSGGLDSSIVVACMAEASSKPVKTFSIGIGTKPELPYARQVAERYQTEHHEELVVPNMIDLLPAIVRGHGEPFADPSAVPTRVLAELTRKHVTVALSGDGGDEAFGGYKRYAWARVAHALTDHGAVLRGSAALLERIPSGRARWLREYGRVLRTDEAERYMRFVGHFSAGEKAAIYTPELRARFERDHSTDRFARILADSRSPDPVGRLMELDTRTYLPDDICAKVDISSMAHSLEVRAPFLDHHVMELAASLPTSLQVRGLTGKRLLRRAFADRVPAGVLQRKKRGFSLPLASWFSGELAGYAREILLSTPARTRGLFEPAAVERLLDRHRRGEDHGDRIWNLLVLELWFREVLG
jgi:asparagine synthase (glutamine-hydrolysing)